MTTRVTVSMPADPTVPRFLSQASCHALLTELQTLGLAHEALRLWSFWRGDVRWGRNRVSVARDWRTNEIAFQVGKAGGKSYETNQINAASLRAMVRLVQQE